MQYYFSRSENLTNGISTYEILYIAI